MNHNEIGPKIICPCCGFYTIENEREIIVDICEVCYWQYDVVAQENPDRVIGPNCVSLNEAIKNYKSYGAKERRVLEFVRQPNDDELPENNQV